jgi:hypothetical protein
VSSHHHSPEGSQTQSSHHPSSHLHQGDQLTTIQANQGNDQVLISNEKLQSSNKVQIDSKHEPAQSAQRIQLPKAPRNDLPTYAFSSQK